jgi:Tn3 transposase DDE domain
MRISPTFLSGQIYVSTPGSASAARYVAAYAIACFRADPHEDLRTAQHLGNSPTHLRRRHLDDQVDQALCLTLVTNAAVLWTTTYLGDALDALRADDYPVTDEHAANLTPAQHDHINFYGTYSFDVETDLRRKGYRPLRSVEVRDESSWPLASSD